MAERLEIALVLETASVSDGRQLGVLTYRAGGSQNNYVPFEVSPTGDVDIPQASEESRALVEGVVKLAKRAQAHSTAHLRAVVEELLQDARNGESKH